MSKEFCDEFAKSSGTIKKENMEMELGLLILPLLTKYSDEIKKVWHLDASNKDDLEKIGYKIGQNAALDCPSFRNFLKNNMDVFVNEGEKKVQNEGLVSGTLLKIEGQTFSYLLVRNKAGKTEKIYWMDFFEGADKLSSGEKQYLNKMVQVAYKEQDVWDPVNKEYKKIKIATRFEE